MSGPFSGGPFSGGNVRVAPGLPFQGLIGPTGQGFNYRGQWAANTAYAAYDVVTFSGSSYVATALLAPAGSFDPSQWSLFAAGGGGGGGGGTTGGVAAVRTVTSGSTIAVVAADGVVRVEKATGSPTAVTLEPNPAIGATHTIKDGRGDAATNPITITAASGTIDGAPSVVINTPRAGVTLCFAGDEWVVTSGAPASMPVVTIGPSGAAVTLPWVGGLGVIYDITLTAPLVTLSTSGGTPGIGQTMVLRLREDSTGNRTVAVPPGWEFPQGQALVLSPGPNAVDDVQVLTTDGGTSATLYQIGSNFAGLTIGQAPSATPNRPDAPALTAVAGNGQVTLTAVDGLSNGSAITTHTLYRGTASGAEVLIGTVTLGTGGTYVDTGLSNGTAYFYKLSATNAVGEGPQSPEATATPAAQAVSSAVNMTGSSYVITQATNAMLPGGEPFSLRVKCQLSALAGSQFLLSLWDTQVPANNVFTLYLNGNLFNVAYEGPNYQGIEASATVPASITTTPLWLRADVTPETTNPRTVVLSYYTSADGVSWTALGSPQTVTTNEVPNSPSLANLFLAVGCETGTGNKATGRFMEAALLINGVTVSDVSFAGHALGATTVADGQGNAWFLGGGAALV